MEVPIELHPTYNNEDKDLAKMGGVECFLSVGCKLHYEAEIWRLQRLADRQTTTITKERREFDAIRIRCEKAEKGLGEMLQHGNTFPPPSQMRGPVSLDGVTHYLCPCGCGQHLTAPRMASHFCAKIP